MANGLYTRDEVACMTDSALDELLGYYGDVGSTEGAQLVRDELESREDDREAQADMEAERTQEADQDRQQTLHDEMLANGDAESWCPTPDYA